MYESPHEYPNDFRLMILKTRKNRKKNLILKSVHFLEILAFLPSFQKFCNFMYVLKFETNIRITLGGRRDIANVTQLY